MGLRWAPVFDGVVRLGFLLSVLGIFPMQVGPLRPALGCCSAMLPWVDAPCQLAN